MRLQHLWANRGLKRVDPENALAESEVIRYPYEASGVSSCLAVDRPGESPVSNRADNALWYGLNWYYVTTKGTTKETSFVGSDYGEMRAAVYHPGLISDDHKLIDQALKMLRARADFWFPSVDKDGFQFTNVTELIT